MMRTILIIGIAGLLAFSSCELKTPYQKLEARELASGERYDSLFLGISFGMRADSFYEHCFSLNRQQIVKEGMGNTSVLYEPKVFNGEVAMNFYPEFNKETEGIRRMPVLFNYYGWAPWNKPYHADSLLPKVLDMFNDWYGGDFLEITHPDKGSVFVKVNGNRRIRVFAKDDQFVQAIFKDLTQEEAES